MPSKGEKRKEQQLRQRPQRLEYQRQKQKLRREWWKELKRSLACKACGNSDWRCLDFHHRDPTTKKFNISAAILYSKETIAAEMEKCDVLCANCHRIIHWEEQNQRIKTRTEGPDR